jgi:hypothetical protein
VAIGFASASSSNPGDIAVWTTNDGRVWTRVPSPSAFTSAATSAVAWGSGGLVAIADSSWGDEPGSTEVMLTSPDGVTWQASPTPGRIHTGHGVHRGRYVGVRAPPHGTPARSGTAPCQCPRW